MQERTFRGQARRRWLRLGLGLGGLSLACLAVIAGVALFSDSSSIEHSSADPVVATRRPPPGVGVSSRPLGTPARAPESSSYSFLSTQVLGDPITWDPCRPIRYVVNDRTAPPGGPRLLREAVAKVSEATGLRFIDEGTVDEAPQVGRQGYDPDRYGERWAPVLMAWTDPSEHPPVGGSVIGEAGPVAASRPSDSMQSVYVSGLLALDGPDVAQMLEDHDEGEEMVTALIIHELGHLVGLGHVADEMQLMNSYVVHGVNDLGAGDRAGLHRLGTGPCAPDV